MKRIFKLIIIILFIIAFLFFILKYITDIVSPKLINYAELEIRKISGLIITKSISSDSLDRMNVNDLFIISRNNNNEILCVDLNTVMVNRIIREATVNIEENLKQLEAGNIDNYNNESSSGVVLEVPLGMVYNSFLLNDKGPKIPVKLKVLGDVELVTDTKVTNYGINSALIEISLDTIIREKVILPISSKEIVVKGKTPLAIKLVQGTVPNYYADGINKSQTFSIPLE